MWCQHCEFVLDEDASGFCPEHGTPLLPDEARGWLGRVFVERMEVTEFLGLGATSIVLRVHHRTLGRDAALKVLREGAAQSAPLVDGFVGEARTLERIRDPGIVRLFEFGTSAEGERYMVLELLEGGTLEGWLAQRGRCSLAEGIAIGACVAKALAVAHARGFVHGDLKPANVLRESSGKAVGPLRVADFGMAKAFRPRLELLSQGKVAGTPLYMAPEQWQGRGIDPRADVYALGAMLFELWTGSPPFVAPTMQALCLQHMTAPIPSLSSARKDLPPDCERIVRRALAKEPAERFASAAELGDALVELAELEHGAGATTMGTLALMGGMTAIEATTGSVPPRSAELVLQEVLRLASVRARNLRALEHLATHREVPWSANERALDALLAELDREARRHEAVANELNTELAALHDRWAFARDGELDEAALARRVREVEGALVRHLAREEWQVFLRTASERALYALASLDAEATSRLERLGARHDLYAPPLRDTVRAIANLERLLLSASSIARASGVLPPKQ